MLRFSNNNGDAVCIDPRQIAAVFEVRLPPPAIGRVTGIHLGGGQHLAVKETVEEVLAAIAKVSSNERERRAHDPLT